MKRGTWSFFDQATGAISTRRFTGSEALVAINTPAGMQAIEGAVDPLSQRVDLATGEVIDYQPPQPDADHEWRDNVRNGRPRWVKRADVVAREVRDAEARKRIAELEVRQQRAMREHTLGDSSAIERLRSIDNEIASLRSDIQQTR